VASTSASSTIGTLRCKLKKRIDTAGELPP
jgi:hypothetical protein